MTAIRRALAPAVMVTIVIAIGCGARTPGPPARSGIGAPPEIVGSVAGATVAIVPRATEGRTWIALWIDAGSRDADPPQLATVAAWEATEGTEVRARVLPDGTELAIACPTPQLDPCVASLARTLARRDPEPTALAAALERLRATRRGARADEARLADRLAVEALLGDARGLDPLGEHDDDARIDARSVAAFRAASWGPSRALVVIVGDADEGHVRESIAAHFGRSPAATAERVERSIEPRVAARVEVGDRERASVALAVRGADRGTAIARRVIDELPGSTASVFPLRGGQIVLVRGEDPAIVAESVAHARAMVTGGDERPVDADDPDAIASRLGASWVARAGDVAPEGGIGIGAVIGSDDRGTGEDPGAEARAEAERALTAIAARVIAPGTGTIARDRLDGAIVLTSEDGARALARREGVGRVAIALAIDAPAALEPASAHGRRALLARILARCAAPVGESTAFVEDRAVGVVLEVQPQRAIEGIDALTRCARTPPLDPATIEAERAAAIAALDDRDRAVALASLGIAPGAPALVAPRGTIESLAGLDARAIAAGWRGLASRDRATLAIVGEVDEEVVARSAVLGLRRLPAASRPRRDDATAGIAADEVIAARAPGETVEVVIGLRDPSPRGRGATPAVRALATLIARELAGGALAPIAIEGDAGEGGAWIAIAVRGDEDAIATIPARLARARAIDPERALRRATERAAEERALASASASTLARRLATGRGGDVPDPALGRDAARALLAVPARIVVARPAPGSWRTRR